MALNRRGTAPEGNEGNEGDYDKLGGGEFDGRLVYVADLGMQEGMVWQGKQKPDATQISLGIEIVDNKVTIDGTLHPRILWSQPFNIFNSLTEKGKELKFFNVFGEGEIGEEADWEGVLGTPCNVKVVVGASKDGTKTFDNIGSLAPYPEKFVDSVTKGELEPCIGDADDESNSATMALHGLAKWVWDKRIQGNEFA